MQICCMEEKNDPSVQHISNNGHNVMSLRCSQGWIGEQDPIPGLCAWVIFSGFGFWGVASKPH